MTKRSLLSKIRSICRLPLVDTADLDNTIWLAGTGRSGTTWVAELLNHDHEFRTIFEPFHPKRSHTLLQTEGRPFAYPGVDTVYSEQLDLILTGRFRSKWTDQYNSKVIYNRRLIKAIRGNLLLPWIGNNYSRLSVIFVIRNPVLNSISRINGNWPTPLEYFDHNDILKLHPAISHYVGRRGSLSDWEKAIVFWCIENLIGIVGLNGKGYIISYEELVRNPFKAVRGMFKYANVNATDDLMVKISKPSSMARKGKKITSSADAIELAYLGVDKKMRESAFGIVCEFGLGGLYGRSGVPVADVQCWRESLHSLDGLFT